MTKAEILNDIKIRFKDDVTSVFEKSPQRVYFDIQAGALEKVSRHVFKELKARFNIASGVDAREHMEILYHFSFDEKDLIVSFRVRLDKSHLEIQSLAPLFEGANWIEREIHEILGINFIGHPDLRRLLLPDEWPEGVYPLRRDYQEWDKDAIRDRGV
jgi:NADH-quinone oxidoreductase subunit C